TLPRQRRGARDESLEAARMAEPVPAVEPAAHEAEPVIGLAERRGIAPVPAGHFAAAGGRQGGPPRARRPPGGGSGAIRGGAGGGGADEAGGRAVGAEVLLARDHHAPPEQDAAAVAARHRHPAPERHVRYGFLEPRGRDHFARTQAEYASSPSASITLPSSA